MSSKQKMKPLSSRAVTTLKGKVTVPGDKSISHRALMLSSQAIGESTVTGLLESEDVIHTAKALEQMGVGIRKNGKTWKVRGVGTGGLQEPEGVLDMGNSGTAARLMMGLVSPYPFASTFDGDDSLRKRPMKRATLPLEQMGVEIISREGGLMPVTIRGSEQLIPITYEVPVPSAQVKSAVLMAALNTPGITTVIEKTPTRDHTERMLKGMGAKIAVKKVGGKVHIKLTGQPELKPQKIVVPADPSSAAFLVVAALITKKSNVTITNVCMNVHRTGLYTTLKEMGAKITFVNKRKVAGEEVADIVVKSSQLKGIKVPAKRAASMIDEYPILSIAAAFAKGTTEMLGLEELRVKESDRLSAIADGLKACGVKYAEHESSLEVLGAPVVRGGGHIKTHMDHRIAMAFLVLGMVSQKPVTVDDGSMINTSFPGFVELMNKLGAKIK